jgi:hypothetical protein
MKEIKLNSGKIAIVDDADFDFINQWKWSCRSTKRWFCYAMRQEWLGTNETKRFQHILMHRLILNAPREMEVDHIDGNPLNNQRSNLRLVTPSQNACNVPRRCDNHSGYKGVGWSKIVGKWRARIMKEGKTRYLGYFDNVEDAAAAYVEAAKKLHGVFARF